MTNDDRQIASAEHRAEEHLASPRRGKVCFVVSEDWFFVSHFLPMVHAAQACDLDVVVVARVRDHGALIAATGARLIPLEGDRATRSPFQLLRTMVRLVRILAQERPDVVHLIALWGILLGGLAATFARVPARIIALTGHGHFAARKDWRASLVWQVFKALTRGPVSVGEVRYLFENTADAKALGLNAADPRAILIGGAGVDPDALRPEPLPPGPVLKVAIVARMLFSKGIDLAVDAVTRARTDGQMIELDLYGAPDSANPGAVSLERLEKWSALEGIHWHGPTKDVAGVWAKSHVCCLPSRGGEGLPRTLLEGAACGRAVVTTAVPGCSDFIRDGIEGIVVPPENAAALAAAFTRLAADPSLVARLGDAARARVLDGYTVDAVSARLAYVYRELSRSRPKPEMSKVGALARMILQELRRVWQGLGHVLTVLRSEPEPSDEPRDPQDLACEALLAEMAALGDADRHVLAKHVSQLWKAFHATFKGLDGFLKATPEMRSAYFAQLEVFVARCPFDAAGRRNVMALAAALMAAYIQNLGRETPPECVRQLGVETAQLIGSARVSGSGP